MCKMHNIKTSGLDRFVISVDAAVFLKFLETLEVRLWVCPPRVLTTLASSSHGWDGIPKQLNIL